jgi:tripartite-type tricarboxylate transporter receptor subunit TctC
MVGDTMRKCLWLGSIVLFWFYVAVAAAQDWPAKQPVRVIVTNTPGSGIDVTVRAVFEQVSKQLGQAVFIENRAGAANTIGIAAAAKSEPDGYTVLATTSGIALAPYTHKNLPYDTTRDVMAVIPLGSLTNVMMTPAGRFKSVQDLVAQAKAKPGGISYATIGPGSTGHLSAERLALSAGFKALHVPFKGTAEGLIDVAAGRVDFFFNPVIAGLAMIQEKKLDALAVSSTARSSLLPAVPTTVEAGYPDSSYDFWIGIFVPSATSEPIVTRLHAEVRKTLALPEIKSRLAKLGVEPMDMNREQFDAYFKREIENNATLVKAANISAN